MSERGLLKLRYEANTTSLINTFNDGGTLYYIMNKPIVETQKEVEKPSFYLFYTECYTFCGPKLVTLRSILIFKSLVFCAHSWTTSIQQ